MSELNEILTQYKTMRKKISDAVRPAIVEASKAVFAADDGVKSLVWTQYTPYFNDGEPCVFSVNEATLFFADNHPLAKEQDEDDDGSGFYGMDGWALKSKGDNYATLAIALNKFNDLIEDSTISDCMQDAFGDHVAVTIKRSGSIATDEHSHD